MAKGEVKGIDILFPCHSLAQEVKIDFYSYFEFVKKPFMLDKEDPI